MAKFKSATRKIIDDSCYMIFRNCDYMSLHTNVNNKKCINDIIKNVMSIYSAVRDLHNENLKLKAEKTQERRLKYEF